MKVGDKVRVVADQVYYSTPAGMVGTLSHYRSGPYGCTVVFKNIDLDFIFDEGELDLVEESYND